MSIEAARQAVEDVVSSLLLDPEEKIKQLKAIDQDKYKPLIKELAYKKTISEFKDLARVFEDLAHLSTNLGDLSGHLQHYTDAAVFYQYSLAIINEKINSDLSDPGHVGKVTNIYKALDALSNKILSISSIIASGSTVLRDNQTESVENKKILSALRENVAAKMSAIEEWRVKSTKAEDTTAKTEYQEQYVNGARRLFEEITEGMKGFLAKLYYDAEHEIGAPPCKYAVMGLGSMALKQITPYSDLEFAILTENEDYKSSDDPKIREYFKNLSHLVNFKMINLGESTIPTSRYGLNLDHLVHKGVNFDLGGKTPLGRIEHDKFYDLVQTIEKMLLYVRNEEEKVSHIDKNLPYILEKICHVHGDAALLSSYIQGVNVFLNDRIVKTMKYTSKSGEVIAQEMVLFNYQDRALKHLHEEIAEIDDAKHINIRTQGDLERFAPLAGENESRLFNVKQEIYRLPDRLLYNLGQYYGIDGQSVWDTVDQLCSREVINEVASINLKNAATFATTLRLKTYLHNKGQIEDISPFASNIHEAMHNEDIAKALHLSVEELEEQGGLFQYFYTALPLHHTLFKFHHEYKDLSQGDINIFFKTSNFFLDNAANKGLVYYRLMQYQQALTNLEQAVSQCKDDFNLLDIIYRLGVIYHTCDIWDKARKSFEFCLDMYKLLLPEEMLRQNVVLCLERLGGICSMQEQYDAAIEYLMQSLYMRIALCKDQPDVNVAYCLNHLGSVYHSSGDYDKAIEYYNLSLNMKKIIHKGVPHADFAVSLRGLGNVYADKQEYDKAIAYLIQSINIVSSIDSNVLFPEKADALNGLGVVYTKQGKYHEAIKYFKGSVGIYETLYHKQPCPQIVPILNNLGGAYDEDGQSELAMECFLKALKIGKTFYGNRPNANIAECLNNIGLIYKARGQYVEAITYFNDSMEIQRQLHPDGPNSFIITILDNLGSACRGMKEYDKAIEYLTQSLNINEALYEQRPHPDRAKTLCNLSNVYYDMGNEQESIKYRSKAVQIISVFPTHYLYEKMGFELIKIAAQFANTHSLNIPRTLCQVMPFAIQGKDFTDYKVHYDAALLLQDNSEDSNVSAIIEEYRLALIFMPESEVIIRSEIYSNLSKLLSIDQQNLRLWLAVMDNNSDQMESLLCHGVNPNTSVNDGDTLVHIAHYKASINTIRLLLKHNANINSQNNVGKTPLHCLLENAYIPVEDKMKVIEEFLPKYNLALQDQEGKTVIDYAAEHCPEVLASLLKDVTDNQDGIDREFIAAADDVDHTLVEPYMLAGYYDVGILSDGDRMTYVMLDIIEKCNEFSALYYQVCNKFGSKKDNIKRLKDKVNEIQLIGAKDTTELKEYLETLITHKYNIELMIPYHAICTDLHLSENEQVLQHKNTHFGLLGTLEEILTI